MSEFLNQNGQAVPAVTAEQMREIDRIAVEQTGPNLYQMMENAGRNLAELALKTLGESWSESQIIVLAGSGGNGGGGICAARHLANRGARVVLCLSTPDRLSGMPAFQDKIYQSTSGEEIHSSELTAISADLVLDALIGYGLNSTPHDDVAEIIGWANQAGAPIISLDIPSGIEATNGRTPGEYIRPTHTLTLALPKTGLTAENSGELYLADIGIPTETFRLVGIDYSSPFGDCYLAPLKIIE